MSSSEYLVLELECSFTKYVPSRPNTKYVYLGLPYSIMKCVLDNTSESGGFFFLISGEVLLYKEWELERLLIAWLKVGDLK